MSELTVDRMIGAVYARTSTEYGRETMGHIYRRGAIWWIQFYQDGQRVRMTTESTDGAPKWPLSPADLRAPQWGR